MYLSKVVSEKQDLIILALMISYGQGSQNAVDHLLLTLPSASSCPAHRSTVPSSVLDCLMKHPFWYCQLPLAVIRDVSLISLVITITVHSNCVGNLQ